jgi:hypothetical protein
MYVSYYSSYGNNYLYNMDSYGLNSHTMALGFIAHPEVSSVVVEHLIQTCVPMAMHEALKAEMNVVKASIKTSSTTVEKLDSKMACKATGIGKLQQYFKVALKNK